MSKVRFMVRRANQRQAETISFPKGESRTKSQLASTLATRYGFSENESETIEMTNVTTGKKIVDGNLVDQISTDDEVVVATRGTAGILEAV